ncbi:hypothetical protein [Aquabacterium sp. OR-4]|uniref:hypothetical protein n=1 Tax=Aquabacterium sp. OR-4 TaxID=2978127 RepID=UPI0021B24E45|nr:hypothetical protein [Aquabacterium sp. OR-4]MDT7838305.1 hypothetical protein [Aquabacterium sp. OR-4]
MTQRSTPRHRLPHGQQGRQRGHGLARIALACLAGLSTLSGHAPALANDYPTAERVRYVLDCMRANPGPQFEMLSKCSCALDAVAAEVPHEAYVSMSTAANAISIGGERGSELRDNESIKPQIKRLRELQAKAAQRCFIQPR